MAPPISATPTLHLYSSSGVLQNGRPVRENSVALRYISDPTNNNQLERDTCSHGTHWEYWEYWEYLNMYFE